MKCNKFSLKPKDVLLKIFHKIAWNLIKAMDKICPALVHFSWYRKKLMEFTKYYTDFTVLRAPRHSA
jgi:hypothetical protein